MQLWRSKLIAPNKLWYTYLITCFSMKTIWWCSPVLRAKLSYLLIYITPFWKALTNLSLSQHIDDQKNNNSSFVISKKDYWSQCVKSHALYPIFFSFVSIPLEYFLNHWTKCRRICLHYTQVLPPLFSFCWQRLCYTLKTWEWKRLV